MTYKELNPTQRTAVRNILKRWEISYKTVLGTPKRNHEGRMITRKTCLIDHTHLEKALVKIKADNFICKRGHYKIGKKQSSIRTATKYINKLKEK